MMKPVENHTLVRQLEWRYATKQFDPNRKISAADWQALEKSLLFAPSSFGLQPWKFFVIDDPAVRAKLQPFSWNQSQVVEASHLVVLAAKTELAVADIDRYLERIAEVRDVTLESLAGFKKMLLGSLNHSPEATLEWATRQVYIALGFFLSAAAMLGIDACPLEGFQPNDYDEVLGLKKLGYHSVVLATAGYRSSTDKYAAIPKVRFPHEHVVTHLP